MAKFSELNGKQKAIVIVVGIAVFLAIYFMVSSIFSGLDGASSKIEVLVEPTMSTAYDSLGFYPKVTVEVRNKTSGTITVYMHCSIYDQDGRVTTNLSSETKTLAAGESTRLVAESYVSYSFTEYSRLCASFGNVEYKFL